MRANQALEQRAESFRRDALANAAVRISGSGSRRDDSSQIKARGGRESYLSSRCNHFAGPVALRAQTVTMLAALLSEKAIESSPLGEAGKP